VSLRAVLGTGQQWMHHKLVQNCSNSSPQLPLPAAAVRVVCTRLRAAARCQCWQVSSLPCPYVSFGQSLQDVVKHGCDAVLSGLAALSLAATTGSGNSMGNCAAGDSHPDSTPHSSCPGEALSSSSCGGGSAGCDTYDDATSSGGSAVSSKWLPAAACRAGPPLKQEEFGWLPSTAEGAVPWLRLSLGSTAGYAQGGMTQLNNLLLHHKAAIGAV
jgi:hypothetical protein